MKQAIVIAAFCEFGGAVLLVRCLYATWPVAHVPPTCWPTLRGAHDLQGAGVTDTIRGGIADLTYYKSKPDLYM